MTHWHSLACNNRMLDRMAFCCNCRLSTHCKLCKHVARSGRSGWWGHCGKLDISILSTQYLDYDIYRCQVCSKSYPFSNSLLHKWSDNIVTIRIFSCLLFPRVQCGQDRDAVCCMLSAWPRCKCVQRSDYTQEYHGSRHWRFLLCLPQFARKIRNVTEERNSPIWTLCPVDMCGHWPDYDQPYITRCGGWLMTRASNEDSRRYPNNGESPYYRAFSWLKALSSRRRP